MCGASSTPSGLGTFSTPLPGVALRFTPGYNPSPASRAGSPTQSETHAFAGKPPTLNTYKSLGYYQLSLRDKVPVR